MNENDIINKDLPNTYEGRNLELFEDDNTYEKYYIDSICDHREKCMLLIRKRIRDPLSNLE